MKHIDRQKFQLWARSPEYRELVSETKVRLDSWAQEFDAPHISFSGGKDSTVLLHIAIQHWPDEQIVIWHWDYGEWLVPRPYEKEVWKNATEIIADRDIEFRIDRRPGGKEARETSGTGYRAFFGTLSRMAREMNRDCGLTGMRAAESQGRKIRSKNYCEKDSATGLPLLYPLRDWKAGDCWAYIISKNIPYHSVYDTYAPLKGGYASERNRFVTFFDQEMVRFGSPYVDGILSWHFRDDIE